MLITLLILIGLVVIAMIATRKTKSDNTGNRYHRKKIFKNEPTVQRDQKDPAVDEEDSDTVLGLKPHKKIPEVSSKASPDAAPKVISMNLEAPQGHAYSGYELFNIWSVLSRRATSPILGGVIMSILLGFGGSVLFLDRAKYFKIIRRPDRYAGFILFSIAGTIIVYRALS